MSEIKPHLAYIRSGKAETLRYTENEVVRLPFLKRPLTILFSIFAFADFLSLAGCLCGNILGIDPFNNRLVRRLVESKAKRKII